MTGPRTTATGEGGPTPWPLLLLPYAVILVAAALTDDFQLHSNQGDIGLYLDKALALLSGLVPYRDYPLEYPPLALIPMVVPAVLWPFGPVTVELYKWLFAGWEAVLMLALGYVLVRITRLGGDGDAWHDEPIGDVAGRLRTVAWRLFVLTIGAALAIAFRYDLFPALLVMVAVWATLDRRPGVAGLSIGLGVVAKLFPLAIVPALVVPWLLPLDLRRLTRFAVAAIGAVAVVMVPFLVLAGDDALAFLRYQSERGLQIESIGGGLAVLGGLIAGRPVELTYGFSAVQVEGPFPIAWLAALPIATVVGFGLLGLVGWRRINADQRAGGIQPGTVVALAGAAVLVLLVTSKVFSIQYVVWIVPFAALLRGRQFWLAAALVALTMPIHPGLYADLVKQLPLPILILNIRNGLLLVLLGMVVRDLATAAPAVRRGQLRRVSPT
ncbi:MAG TPA: glycosyltransferase family 87 protein [Candidatus Limnocylindrales bacterium]